MTVSVTQINPATDTWQVLIGRVNDMAGYMSNAMVTVSATPGGSVSSGNAAVNGFFTANTLSTPTLRGGNNTVTAALSISTNVLIGSLANITTTGVARFIDVGVGANVTVNTSVVKIGNATVNVVANSSTVTINGVNVATVANSSVVALNGTNVGTRPKINFTPGNNITLAVTDDGVGNQVTVQINSTFVATPPGGSDNQIQYKSGSSFAGDAGLTYNATTDTLTVANGVVAARVDVGANVDLDPTQLFIGNSTVNATHTATQLAVRDAASAVVINSTMVAIGSTNVATLATRAAASTFVRPKFNFVSGTNATVTVTDDAVGQQINVQISATSVATSPGGGASQVQFNNGSGFAGEAEFTYNATTDSLSVANAISHAISNVSNRVDVGANVTANTSAVKVGNSTVNAVVTSQAITLSGVNVATENNRAAVNTGAAVATRPKFNFVPGNNIDIDISEDATGNQINVAITATAEAILTSPGGPNTAVQFSNGTGFVGNASFTYNSTTNTLAVANALVVAIVNTSTIVEVGANVHVNTSAIEIGNTSVNTVINSSAISLSGVAVATVNNRAAAGTFARPKFNFVQGGATTIAVTEDVAGNQINVQITSTDTNTTTNPGGSADNQVQYRATSTTFGGSAGMVFVPTTNNFTVSNTVSAVFFTATTNYTVGANVTLDATRLFVGNSTVNAIISSSAITLSGVSVATVNNRAAASTFTRPKFNFTGGGIVSVSTTDDASGNQINVAITASSSGTPAAGADTQVQFNSGGTNFAGDAGLTYNATTNNLTVANTLSAAVVDLNNVVQQSGVDNHTTPSAGVAFVVDQWSISSYRAAKYTLSFSQGTNYHMNTIHMLHNGTDIHAVEYGSMTIGTVGTWSVDINTGNARLLFTSASTSSIVIHGEKTYIDIN